MSRGRRSVSYKHITCQCNTPDNPNGCEECTCRDCGDWLTTADSDTCSACIEKQDKEYEESNW